MKYGNVEFDTYFKNYPDANGYFGKYGGSYIAPELQVAMNEIAEAYDIERLPWLIEDTPVRCSFSAIYCLLANCNIALG